MQDWESVAKVAYESYKISTGGKTYDGKDMPDWDALPPRVRNAWKEASRGVLRALAGQDVPSIDAAFTERERATIQLSLIYEKEYAQAGISGHNFLLLIGKLSRFLNLGKGHDSN